MEDRRQTRTRRLRKGLRLVHEEDEHLTPPLATADRVEDTRLGDLAARCAQLEEDVTPEVARLEPPCKSRTSM